MQKTILMLLLMICSLGAVEIVKSETDNHKAIRETVDLMKKSGPIVLDSFTRIMSSKANYKNDSLSVIMEVSKHNLLKGISKNANKEITVLSEKNKDILISILKRNTIHSSCMSFYEERNVSITINYYFLFKETNEKFYQLQVTKKDCKN